MKINLNNIKVAIFDKIINKVGENSMKENNKKKESLPSTSINWVIPT